MSKKNRLLGITFISGNTEFFPPRIIKESIWVKKDNLQQQKDNDIGYVEDI